MRSHRPPGPPAAPTPCTTPAPPRAPRPGDFPFSCKQNTHPSHPLLQRRAGGDNEHQASPRHALPLNPFWEHPGPPPADHRSGLHNGKSMQKYFSHNAFQPYTQPAMLIGSEALLREFKSLFRARTAGGRRNPCLRPCSLHQDPHLSVWSWFWRKFRQRGAVARLGWGLAVCAPTAMTDPSCPWGTQREVNRSLNGVQQQGRGAQTQLHGMFAAAHPAVTP